MLVAARSRGRWCVDFPLDSETVNDAPTVPCLVYRCICARRDGAGCGAAERQWFLVGLVALFFELRRSER